MSWVYMFAQAWPTLLFMAIVAGIMMHMKSVMNEYRALNAEQDEIIIKLLKEVDTFNAANNTVKTAASSSTFNNGARVSEVTTKDIEH